MRKQLAVRIKPKQSLGQNFLVDDNIVRNIVRDLNLQKDDIVVEIGPGLGALTRELAKNLERLIVVEIDQRAVEKLTKEFSGSNVTVIHGDILDIPFANISKQSGRNIRVIGNIPYHLTSPILFKVFDEHASVRDLTIMIQREVAKRILAEPGSKEYGILSVITRWHGKPRMLFSVSPNCFYPKPKVTSAVIQITLHKNAPYNVNNVILTTIVKTAFGKRRKVLRNSLTYLPYDEAIVRKIISEQREMMDRRPEQLTLEEFAELAGIFQQNMQ